MAVTMSKELLIRIPEPLLSVASKKPAHMNISLCQLLFVNFLKKE